MSTQEKSRRFKEERTGVRSDLLLPGNELDDT